MNERKWIDLWASKHMFEPKVDYTKRKSFVTFPIPYMNGPLHLGHALSVIRVDVYARFKRMNGFNVLFPQGWQWTGQSITSAVSRLTKGDQAMIHEFKDLDGVDDETLKKFNDPLFMARYYTEKNKQALISLGISIDWRREFHTTSDDARYSKFIEWQFLTLRDMGYVTRGTHPVIWCPRDKSPVGDHDRLSGEGVFAQEFTLIMFKLIDEDRFLVASTLRPETLFGTTNVWVSKDITYLEVQVNDKHWIIGEAALGKLEDQLFNVKVIRRLKGSELVGKSCIVPITLKEVPILQATFIDPDLATGVVFSVPAHAPFDMLALLDISDNKIEPISVIEINGYGDVPALDIIKRMGLKGQDDARAEEATRELYTKEYREGRMKGNCGEFAGMEVPAARALIIKRLSDIGLGATMYDLTEPVICRCTAKCTVKILSDQWFFKYSDAKWKENARLCLQRMDILPENARPWFYEVISWLNDYPCARTSGLGTPLPWDKKWVIETLSDSTVYMAYYTFSHLLRTIDPTQLTPALFNYVLLGKGQVDELAKSTGLATDIIESMRSEFLYWYPVDLRNSAKELVPNHLTFYIFHHVALFEEDKWPRRISVNGMLQKEGQKMSKSRGNVLTVSAAVSKYGADVVRATLLMSAENMDDANWRDDDARNLYEKLNRLFKLFDEFVNVNGEAADGGPPDYVDDWLINRLYFGVHKVSDLIESMHTRSAMQIAFFDLNNNFREYLKMKAHPNPLIVKKYLDGWARVLEPFMPFTAEELIEKLGVNEAITEGSWPSNIHFNEDAEFRVKAVSKLVEDIKAIKRVVKLENQSFYIYVANREKADVYAEIVNGKKPNVKIDKRLLQNMFKFSKELTDLDKKVISKGLADELDIYMAALEYIEKEVGANIKIIDESTAPTVHRSRSSSALPLRPAILVEASK